MSGHQYMPGYWMNETSGVLRPAVIAYLDGMEMTPAQVLAMRAYLRQWINAPAWQGDMIDVLRSQVDAITTCADIQAWIDRAVTEGVDPL